MTSVICATAAVYLGVRGQFQEDSVVSNGVRWVLPHGVRKHVNRRRLVCGVLQRFVARNCLARARVVPLFVRDEIVVIRVHYAVVKANGILFHVLINPVRFEGADFHVIFEPQVSSVHGRVRQPIVLPRSSYFRVVMGNVARHVIGAAVREPIFVIRHNEGAANPFQVGVARRLAIM